MLCGVLALPACGTRSSSSSFDAGGGRSAKAASERTVQAIPPVARPGEPPFQRETVNVRRDRSTGLARGFTIRDGINVTVQEMFTRYASDIGLDPSDSLVPMRPHAQDPFDPTLGVQYYEQYHNGIPVRGFGETVYDSNGFARRVTGRVAHGLSVPTKPMITAVTAINSATAAAFAGKPSWSTPGSQFRPPTATLIIAAESWNKVPQTAKLIWYVDFAASGSERLRSVSVNAVTGAIVDETPTYVH